MSKAEELKSYVAKLFENCNDVEIVKKVAVVDQKIQEIEAEQKKQTEDYNKLLGDYKDVVIHSSFKGDNKNNGGGVPGGSVFDADKALADALKAATEKK